MSTNDFLPIATGGGANVESQPTYLADAVRPLGFGVNAVPPSALWNKMIRQQSVVTSQIIQMLADYSGLNFLDDGNLATLLSNIKTQFRIRLLANTNFYVRSDGSDANNGLANTSGGAWLTLQHALDVISTLYDFNGFQATINIGTGTFAGGTLNARPPGAAQSIILNGNGAANTIFNSSITNNIPGSIVVQNFKMSGGSSAGLIAGGPAASVTIGNGIEFGALSGSTTAHIYAAGGNINCSSNYAISGGAAFHYLAYSAAGIIGLGTGITITLTGTPSFATAFASANIGGVLNVSPISAPIFSGAATGVRYQIDNLSLVFSGGTISATYFPGNSAGINIGHGAVYN